ncbi:MAG: HD-GYP domain-containing protein [Lachnospiraceae bacterium]|nr:HD-GYP domain-containing protein [Lachnospiraceae bacterium]
MRIREKVKEYWGIFRADIYVGERKKQNLRTIQAAALLLVAISLLMTSVNLVQGYYVMMFSTLLLAVVFGIAYAACRRARSRRIPILICGGAILGIFTMYTLQGGNDGFATLWTVLVPMLSMVIVGVQEGISFSLYFQLLYIILFWTPLRSYVAAYYTETFMNRFPVLYFCAFAVSSVAMLLYKKQQMAMDNYQKNLEKAVKDERERVTQISLQAIEAISKTVDAKDKYTEEHSSRVAEYSCMIARELGWEEEQIRELRNSALLHDIGKIGIRDAVLNKPGRLDDEEYRLMKSHTVIGGDILDELSFLKNGGDGARYHHERYDGKGYPAGLKGEEIPAVARLICIADTFDAMNSNRIYRKKCDPEYIRSEIRKGSGSQFDPEMTEAFLRVIEKEQLLA